LHLDVQVETHPQQSIARLQEAWRKADEYKKTHALSAQEESVFDLAILSNVRNSYSHSDDYFESALATLWQFRAEQAELRARPVKTVAVAFNEKISNPVVIEKETPRIWFEIVRVAETEPRNGPTRMESVERWMAVEQ
jgi:hypothetical protein